MARGKGVSGRGGSKAGSRAAGRRGSPKRGASSPKGGGAAGRPRGKAAVRGGAGAGAVTQVGVMARKAKKEVSYERVMVAGGKVRSEHKIPEGVREVFIRTKGLGDDGRLVVDLSQVGRSERDAVRIQFMGVVTDRVVFKGLEGLHVSEFECYAVCGGLNLSGCAEVRSFKCRKLVESGVLTLKKNEAGSAAAGVMQKVEIDELCGRVRLKGHDGIEKDQEKRGLKVSVNGSTEVTLGKKDGGKAKVVVLGSDKKGGVAEGKRETEGFGDVFKYELSQAKKGVPVIIRAPEGTKRLLLVGDLEGDMVIDLSEVNVMSLERIIVAGNVKQGEGVKFVGGERLMFESFHLCSDRVSGGGVIEAGGVLDLNCFHRVDLVCVESIAERGELRVPKNPYTQAQLDEDKDDEICGKGGVITVGEIGKGEEIKVPSGVSRVIVLGDISETGGLKFLGSGKALVQAYGRNIEEAVIDGLIERCVHPSGLDLWSIRVLANERESLRVRVAGKMAGTVLFPSIENEMYYGIGETIDGWRTIRGTGVEVMFMGSTEGGILGSYGHEGRDNGVPRNAPMSMDVLPRSDEVDESDSSSSSTGSTETAEESDDEPRVEGGDAGLWRDMMRLAKSMMFEDQKAAAAGGGAGAGVSAADMDAALAGLDGDGDGFDGVEGVD